MQKNIGTVWNIIVLSTLALFLVAGCAPVEKRTEERLAEVGRVAVLPVSSQLDSPVSEQEMAALQKGAVYATGIMHEILAGNSRVQLIGEDDGVLDATGSRERLGRLVAIGERSGCQAVLLTSIQRFRQRQGGEMAVDSPASAAFAMTLVQVPSGAVLWTGDYTETQESFLANILSGKMGQRGFRWITVEELVRQALKERLAACPYLK